MYGCSDCEGTDVTLGPAGLNGWSPEYAVVVDPGDSTREVLRLMNWWGGTGDRPSFSGTIMTAAWLTANAVYLGSTGWTANIASGTNVRGTDGNIIDVEEVDGSPTGTPTKIIFPNSTLTYVGTEVTYDPDLDWVNIPYQASATYGVYDDGSLSSVTNPWRSYFGGGPGSGTNQDRRRLKYKKNADGTITFMGHFTKQVTLSYNMFDYTPAKGPFFAKVTCESIFAYDDNLPSKIVMQMPCTFVFTDTAAVTSASVVKSYPGIFLIFNEGSAGDAYFQLIGFDTTPASAGYLHCFINGTVADLHVGTSPNYL